MVQKVAHPLATGVDYNPPTGGRATRHLSNGGDPRSQHIVWAIKVSHIPDDQTPQVTVELDVCINST